MQVLYLPGYSSGNPYQQQLRSHLAEQDVDVVIPEGSSAVSVFGLFSLFPILGAMRKYGRPDVLHLHWLHAFILPRDRSNWFSIPLAIQFVFELLVVKTLGVRVVWTVHNLRDHERRADRVELAVRHLLVHLADSVIVHSESVVDTIVDTYRLPDASVAKFAAIQHGHYIDNYPNEVSRETSREFIGADDETVFLYFGRIRPYKNVPELIETFGRLEAESVRLVIVGNPIDEEGADEIRELAADDDRIDLVLEFVPDEDIQLYMQAADTVVLPFSEILTSGSTILAMSFGRAVVVPDIGCVGDLTAHDATQTSLTYDPAHPDGLLHAMKRALKVDTEAAGEANREHAAELDWETVGARTAAVYRGAYPREDSTLSVPVPAD